MPMPLPASKLQQPVGQEGELARRLPCTPFQAGETAPAHHSPQIGDKRLLRVRPPQDAVRLQAGHIETCRSIWASAREALPLRFRRCEAELTASLQGMPKRQLCYVIRGRPCPQWLQVSVWAPIPLHPLPHMCHAVLIKIVEILGVQRIRYRKRANEVHSADGFVPGIERQRERAQLCV